jgi:NAD(P)-dependent dehydrogenase (short-subunit alcohol dehydrogenase family)
MPLCRTLTAQGHELVWASQVLGHVLLLRVLRSRGELTEQTRTVWVSSGGMYLADVDLRDLTRAHAYQRHQVYAVAKRCQVTLAASLAARWSDTWMGSMHPGWVDTAAVRHSMPWFHRITKSNLRTPEEGADTITWLVCEAKTGPSGRFWFDRSEAPVSIPGRRPPTELDADDLLRMVWQQTEAFVR